MSSVDADILRRTPANGFSADVRIRLHLDGRSIPVGQAGGGVLIFDEPILLPATTGELVITIDGHDERWRVTLTPTATPSKVVAAQFASNGR